MASKKQLAWRKKFVKMSKSGAFKKRQTKVDTTLKKKGYLPKVKGYQRCEMCGKKTVGSRGAWFQDFTGQRRICEKCIKEQRKNKPESRKWKNG
tara:strand:- start:292 stop:573 length:282 start_codon:yes stop_codon:yes gene_type:complete